MLRKHFSGSLTATLAVIAALTLTADAKAQQVGHWLQGGLGVDGGTLPGPGFYVTSLGYVYPVSSIKGPNGRSIGGRNHLTVSVYALAVSAVTKTKFLGADYGFQVFMPVAKQRVSSDVFSSRSAQEYGYSDTYFSPLELGWHKSKWDAMFTYGFYTPTGDYSANKFANPGLGFFTNQFQLGGTYHIDKFKKWSASAVTTWEVHSTNTATDVKPGPGVTLEYGVGRRLLNYKLSVGVAGSYYRKLFLDSGSGVSVAFHDQEASVGPEVSYTSLKAHMSLTARYEPQFAVRGRTSGQIAVVTLTVFGLFGAP